MNKKSAFAACYRFARIHAKDEKKPGFRRNIWRKVCSFFAVPADENPIAIQLLRMTYDAIDCTENRGTTRKQQKNRLHYFRREKKCIAKAA